MNWDYIAGFFDGEGNIAIKRRRDRRPQVVLNMTQKRREVLDAILIFLKENDIEGQIYKKNPCFFIQIGNSASTKNFLSAVIEKLIVKKDEAVMGLGVLNAQVQSRTRLSMSEKRTFQECRRNGESFVTIGKRLGRDSSSLFRMTKRLRQEVLPLNQPESRVMEQEPLL